MTHADLPKPHLDLTEIVNKNGIVILRGRPDPATVMPVAGPLVVVFCSFDSSLEFAGHVARSGRNALFVRDNKRTWFALPADVKTIVSAVQKELKSLGSKRVDTIGFSMGAYAALAYGKVIPIRNALALAPRFSPDQDIVPDRRARRNLDRCSDRLALRSVAPGLNGIGWATVVHGSLGPDRAHLPHFPRRKNVDHHIIPGCYHLVLQWLSDRSLLDGLAGDVLTDDRRAAQRHMRAAGTVPRRLMNNRMARAEARLRRALGAIRRRFRAVSTSFLSPITGPTS